MIFREVQHLILISPPVMTDRWRPSLERRQELYGEPPKRMQTLKLEGMHLEASKTTELCAH